MTEENNLSRGNFIQISTRFTLWLAGALGLAGLVRFFSHEPDSGPPTIFDLGPQDDLLENTRTVYPEIPAVLYRNGAEFRAYSLRCTHLGCYLELSGDGFLCPCHGSEFSASGVVLKGPALNDLPQLHLEVNENGNLILDTAGADK